MSLSDSFENSLAKLFFQGTAIANLADNAASGALTNLYVSLHTSDPGEAGTQTTNETSYTGPYARTAVLRTSGGWTVTANVITPVANIDFPPCTGGSATITHLGIGTLVSGAGVLLMSGTITPNIAVSSGVTPRLTTTTQITWD